MSYVSFGLTRCPVVARSYASATRSTVASSYSRPVIISSIGAPSTNACARQARCPKEAAPGSARRAGTSIRHQDLRLESG